MLNSCPCNNACGFLLHRCLFVITQSSSMSQRSCTDNSSHCVASASEAQMFSSSWLKESMACPAEVAAHYMLANTCFYSCFASSSISLHPQSYSIEKSISIKLVGSQPLTVKLSGSHMVTHYIWWNLCMVELLAVVKAYWQMERYRKWNNDLYKRR